MKTFLSLCACLGAAAAFPADLPRDTASILAPGLPAKAPPHWVWLNDMSFMRLTDGRAYLIDADQGSMLGMLSTGFNFVSVLPSRDGSVIYSPETYFSRGVRGTRTDVVSLYDPVHLTPVAEIEIPAKRASAIPMANESALTDDDRFLLVYNFTPAQSTTVVDTRSRKFVTELDTAGCAMAFPTGPRRFFAICADATLLVVRLDDQGQLASAAHTKPLFEREKDPITEKGVRLGDTWYFTSFESIIHPIKADATDATDATGATVGKRWSLVTDAERADGWRTGGLQQLAIHRATKRLYAIMHKGPLSTHKDPGTDVWVYDIATGKRVQQITLKNLATSIQVSQDDQPLLYGAFIASPVLDIYDARSGQYLRSVGDLAQTATLLVTP
ncbi:MAG TPA: amine dehydrogenase large subunit [Steroidobacteraceae bacterium]|nr:amine dehydrogenase large subunit [Steroidobacteraceae bacterium]